MSIKRHYSVILVDKWDKTSLCEMFRSLSKKNISVIFIIYFYPRKLVKVYCSCTELEDGNRPLFFCRYPRQRKALPKFCFGSKEKLVL